MLDKIYGDTSLGLLTDLYSLTMAQGAFRKGIHDQPATFPVTYRTNPFGGNYAVLSGVERGLEFLKRWSFDKEDTDYLRQFGIFEDPFLDYLREAEFYGAIDAMREGTIVYPNEPLLRINAPLAHALIIEPAMINCIGFETLIATKSHRICRAAGGADVIEMGFRRGQGFDGALTASRAAYVGGAAATSLVLAGKVFDIPVRGTHAHAWVMLLDEPEAFRAYAEYYPNNCILLVDTYDTLEGVKRAIPYLQEVRDGDDDKTRAYGVRLDSGDLGSLSIAVRELLDDADLPRARIVASDDLNEDKIRRLRDNGARIDTWGVGTQLVTGGNQSALGCVYKMARYADEMGWHYPVKLSETPIKISMPGNVNVRRYYRDDAGTRTPWADVLWENDMSRPHSDGSMSYAVGDGSQITNRQYPAIWGDLHTIHVANGKRFEQFGYDGGITKGPPRSAFEAREHLKDTWSRAYDDERYPVHTEISLHALRETAINEARKNVPFDMNNPAKSKGAAAV